MRNSLLLTPLRYLRLEDERGVKLSLRNLTATAALTLVFSLPFLVASTANFFHKDGFIDKVGTFSSVLTGFYVAGLLAVATFSEKLGDLDNPIEVGRVLLPSKADEPAHYLSRREYVCIIFGYLAFLSLFITLLSITVVILSSGMPTLRDWKFSLGSVSVSVDRQFVRGIPIIVFGAIASHLAIVTCHGLYYLMDRLYAKKPELLPERPEHAEHEV